MQGLPKWTEYLPTRCDAFEGIVDRSAGGFAMVIEIVSSIVINKSPF